MEKLQLMSGLFPMIAVIVSISIGGWVFTTWLRIKNGYPLDSAWGQALHPKTDKEVDRADQAADRPKMPSSAPSSARSRTGSRRSSGSSPTSRTRLAREIDCAGARQGRECIMGPAEVLSRSSSIGLPSLASVPDLHDAGSGSRKRSWRSKPAWRPRRPRNMRRATPSSRQRVRVLEQIVTDGGVQTAAQIEALRDADASPTRDTAR